MTHDVNLMAMIIKSDRKKNEVMKFLIGQQGNNAVPKLLWKSEEA